MLPIHEVSANSLLEASGDLDGRQVDCGNHSRSGLPFGLLLDPKFERQLQERLSARKLDAMPTICMSKSNVGSLPIGHISFV